MSDKCPAMMDYAVCETLNYIKTHGGLNYSYVARDHFERLIYSVRLLEGICQKSDAILDVGSFPYFVPGYLSLKGFENIITVEIARSDDFPRSPSWNFQTLTLDIEDSAFPVKDDSFDVIVLLEVFEHLYRRPNQVFRELRRILRPGGKIVISTPNGARLANYARILLKKQFGWEMYETSSVYEKLGHFAHIREYSINEIVSYLRNFDFLVKDVIFKSFGQRLESAYGVTKKPISESFYSAVAKKFPFLRILQNNIFVIAHNSK